MGILDQAYGALYGTRRDYRSHSVVLGGLGSSLPSPKLPDWDQPEFQLTNEEWEEVIRLTTAMSWTSWLSAADKYTRGFCKTFPGARSKTEIVCDKSDVSEYMRGKISAYVADKRAEAAAEGTTVEALWGQGKPKGELPTAAPKILMQAVRHQAGIDQSLSAKAKQALEEAADTLSETGEKVGGENWGLWILGGLIVFAAISGGNKEGTPAA